MLNEYKDKIELQKEVLAALPRNNNKNNKLYKAKVEEMLKEYQVDKEVVEEEITKRRNRYLSLEEDPNIDKLTKNIELLLPQIPLLNKYNSSYEKSNLDIILYELGHFYKTDLDKVNKDINRGCTVLNGKGGYTDSEVKIVYTVLSSNQFITLKSFIKENNQEAFITVNDSKEVLGLGFNNDY